MNGGRSTAPGAQPNDGARSMSPVRMVPTPDGGLMTQADFFTDDPECGAELLRVMEPGKHSGERVERDMERVQGILSDWAAMLPLRAICRRWNCHHRVVHGLVQRNPQLVDTLRTRAREGLQRVFAGLVERAECEVHLIPTTQLAVNLGIIADKLVALENGSAGEESAAKSGVAGISAAAAAAWWRERLSSGAQVPKAPEVIDVESRSVTPSDLKSDVKPS